MLQTSSYDTSCKVDSDCVNVTMGTFCQGQPSCLCGNASINTDAENQYEADLKSGGPVVNVCDCVTPIAPHCDVGPSGGVCTHCNGPTDPTPGCGNTTSDGGFPDSGDGGTCIDIETSDYDTSCNVDSDCMLIQTGHYCANPTADVLAFCLIGNAAVNIDGQARYAGVISRLPGNNLCEGPGNFGHARCIAGGAGGVCTYCPAAITPGMVVSTACADGGT